MNNSIVKKVLFLGVQGTSYVFEGQNVEIMRRLSREGWEVWLLNCDAALKSCRYNLAHDPLVCAKCSANVLNLAQRHADVASDRILSMKREYICRELPQPGPANLQELIDWEYEGVNVGRGVASSIISAFRDSDLDVTGVHKPLIDSELCNGIGIARNYRKILEELKPDRVIVYNGRHNHSFPMIDLCEKMKIDYWCHEQGATVGYYQLFKNSLPHSIIERRRIMDEDWNKDPGKGEKNATDWFEAKRVGKNKDNLVFINDQESGLLPEHFSHNKHNIVIFNSSEDEMKTIIEWKHHFYDGQNDAIRQILKIVKGEEGMHVYLRVHPNLAEIDNAYMEELYSLKQHNFTIIMPQEKVDTYSLMSAADKVISFGSTTGIEATYWGVPSILYGRSFYENMDAVYEPKGQKELSELIHDLSLKAKPRYNALKYGYYVSSNGYPFQHFKVGEDRRLYHGEKKITKYNSFIISRLFRFLSDVPVFLKRHKLLTNRLPDVKRLGQSFSYRFLK